MDLISTARTPALLGLAVLLAAGCASGAQSIRPDDMSYEDHLAEASRDQSLAEQHDELADEALVQDQYAFGYYSSHQSAADSFRSQARAHREAADTLANREVTACFDAPEEAPTSCPLTGSGATLEVAEIPGGARVVLDTPDAEATRTAVDCHRAHAAYLGYEGMEGCVFYLRNIAVDVVPAAEGTTELLITSDDPDTVERIREMTLDPSRLLTHTDGGALSAAFCG